LAVPSDSPVRKPARSGFDFSLHMQRLCEDMAQRVEPLRHIDMSRVAVAFAQTRKRSSYGMYASLTPLRFPGGTEQTVRRGRRWRIQRLSDDWGREMLYILRFYLPRFLDLAFREKIVTVVHELWHIGPKFDGDIRRFRGRCQAHSASQAKYDAQVEQVVALWLRQNPPPALYEFLRSGFEELVARHGGIFGRRIPAPKLFPVE